MDIIVYCARCPARGEHEAAYRLLSLALERELGLPMPEIAREPGSAIPTAQLSAQSTTSPSAWT